MTLRPVIEEEADGARDVAHRLPARIESVGRSGRGGLAATGGRAEGLPEPGRGHIGGVSAAAREAWFACPREGARDRLGTPGSTAELLRRCGAVESVDRRNVPTADRRRQGWGGWPGEHAGLVAPLPVDGALSAPARPDVALPAAGGRTRGRDRISARVPDGGERS